jgi:predicted transcriptional regulator
MNALGSITAPLDPATLALVEDLARARGISGPEFAADAIRRAAQDAVDWRAFVQEGIDCVERGEVYTQDEVEAWFEARVAARQRQ